MSLLPLRVNCNNGVHVTLLCLFANLNRIPDSGKSNMYSV